jgi:hypothetical protein
MDGTQHETPIKVSRVTIQEKLNLSKFIKNIEIQLSDVG